MNLWWLRGRGGLLSHSRWRYRGTRGGHLLKVMILKQKMKVYLNRHSRALTLTRLISWEKKIHLWGDVLLSTMHGAQGFILDFSTHLVFLILHLCHSLTLSFSWPPLLLVAPTEAVFQNLPPTPAVVCNLIQLPVLRSHVGVPWRHSRVRIIIGPDLEEENFQIKTWHTVSPPSRMRWKEVLIIGRDRHDLVLGWECLRRMESRQNWRSMKEN